MAKKFVRGITGIKTINNQDLDTNNVNDLLSDGKHNYIHRKKQDGTEEYHNLTDNIKTIQSDNTDLVSVTNYNNTTNSATIRPKHDSQKEQLLESTDNTIVITHGENGTEETTSVDVNFEKVQAKLSAGDGLEIENNQINIQPTGLVNLPANSGFYYGNVVQDGAPYATISLNSDDNKFVQIAFRESVGTAGKIVVKYRFMNNNVPTAWQQMLVDDETIRSLVAQKQNTLTSNASIGVDGTGLMQLYSYQMSYADSMVGSLDTYAKTVKKDTNVTGNPKLEYHFTAKLYEGKTSITIPLNENDTTYFEYILTSYNRTAMINGFVFSLSGSNLTISRDSSTYYQIVSFSHIIDPS